MTADPVMAVVRVKAPADADPHVLEAELTRAICAGGELPVSAEVTLLPARRRKSTGEMRRHWFVALLHSPAHVAAADLVRIAEKASRKAVRRGSGPPPPPRPGR